MGILSIYTDTTGQVTVYPRLIKIVTSDSLSTVTSAGYLNNVSGEGYTFLPNDVFHIVYSATTATSSGTFAIFTCSISNGLITLAAWADAAGVTLPTIANHIATYTNTGGQLSEDPATAISGGNIQAGLSGTAGTLASFPATALKGSLVIAGVANTGNTVTTISNAAMGQASVISIPDPAGATANFAVAPAALVSGNLVSASGTAGLVQDAAIASTNVVVKNAPNTFSGTGSIILPKVNGTEAANAVTASGVSGVITTSALTTAGGATYAITWTNTLITATSTVLLQCEGGTNTTANFSMQLIRGSGTATLTIFNNTAATALNGTILISYLVI